MSKKFLLDNFIIISGQKNAKPQKGKLEIKGNQIGQCGRFNTKNSDYDYIVDGGEKFLVPGFIDMHSHGELMNFTSEGLQSKINQGITTEVTGLCGLGPAPLKNEKRFKEEWMRNSIIRNPLSSWPWNTVDEFFEHLKDAGLDNNIIYLLPHGLLRFYIKEKKKNNMDKAELNKLKAVIKSAFDDGCKGISLGLCYFPAFFSDNKELETVFKEASKNQKPIFVHLRSEGSNILNALNEIISLTEENNCKVNISHLKVIGENNHHKLDKLLRMISNNDFTFDCYPYTFGSTSLEIIIPPKFLKAGLDVLKDTKAREKIKDIYSSGESSSESWDNLPYLLGWDNIYVTAIASKNNEDITGLSIEDIGRKKNKPPAEAAFDLLLEEERVLMQDYFETESILEKILSHNNGCLGTDSLFSKTQQHPRTTSTYTKFLKKYVLEKGLFSLPNAINKISKKPASILNLEERGEISSGNKADLVIFSKESLEKGNIEGSIINGEWKVKDGKFKEKPKPGTIIKS